MCSREVLQKNIKLLPKTNSLFNNKQIKPNVPKLYFLCVFILSAVHFESYLPNTHASLSQPFPAINQQQGWRGQTEEPTQPAQWLPQSIITQKISIIADGWLVWLAAGLAKQAHFGAVWSASPTILKLTGGGQQIWKGGNLVIWCQNNGAEMVVMTRHADAGSIMQDEVVNVDCLYFRQQFKH